MRPIPILATAFALLAPVIWFALTLVNERHPILPWIVCPILLIGAMFTWFPAQERTLANKSFTRAVGFALFIGLIFALLFTVAG